MTEKANVKPDWDGAGLPPVGTVCEYDDCGEFVKTKILAHHPAETDCVWHQAEFGEFSSGRTYSTDSGFYFRPILTDEQLAQKERADAVDGIRQIILRIVRQTHALLQYDVAERMAQAIYEAGYRND